MEDKAFMAGAIIRAIKKNLKRFEGKFKPTPTLINSVNFILKSFYIDNKKYVIGNLPTGSGKTIIGLLTHFCIESIERELLYGLKFDTPPSETYTYFLTSNKILQDQIERDIIRFKLEDDLSQLKGVNNYPCLEATNRMKIDSDFKDRILSKFGEKMTFAPYEIRPCKNDTKEKIQERWCFEECPYKLKRLETANAPCAVLNYAYFLNVMRSEFNPFFDTRLFTIADEAHLIPDIITSMFTSEISYYRYFRFDKFLKEFSLGLSNSFVSECNKSLDTAKNFFSRSLKNTDKYKVEMLSKATANILSNIKSEIKSVSDNYIKNNLEEHKEHFEALNEVISNAYNVFDNSPEDLFIEFEYNNGFYKFIIRDLAEHRLAQTNFIQKCDKILFMSATIGNADNFANMLGLDKKDWTHFRVKSTFDFSKSPINLMNLGKLSYKEIENNLPKVLKSTIDICELHNNERGVIHTGNFQITKKLRELVSNNDRFIFYNDSQEKEVALKELKQKSNGILVGPSLYEGLDLKDDLCRFQILVKVPYVSLTPYIKAKIDRYPFWYEHNCIQKVVQAIGRSNRHKDDYSTIYLLDSLFERIIWKTDEEIYNRIIYPI